MKRRRLPLSSLRVPATTSLSPAVAAIATGAKGSPALVRKSRRCLMSTAHAAAISPELPCRAQVIVEESLEAKSLPEGGHAKQLLLISFPCTTDVLVRSQAPPACMSKSTDVSPSLCLFGLSFIF